MTYNGVNVPNPFVKAIVGAMHISQEEACKLYLSDKSTPKKKKQTVMRLPDDEKIDILESIWRLIDEQFPDWGVDIKNPERELVFEKDGADYSLMLVRHRPFKEAESEE